MAQYLSQILAGIMNWHRCFSDRRAKRTFTCSSQQSKHYKKVKNKNNKKLTAKTPERRR